MTMATAIPVSMPTPIRITPALIPRTEAELLICLTSWEWRIFSGQLYKIIIKGDDETDDTVMPFIPNGAQRDFLGAIHYRNVILKARQLGFTTLIAILWLDHALFNANQRCGIIAQTLDDATAIFVDKVVFAYENLPPSLRHRFPLSRKNTKEIRFGHNNSAVRVAVSMRSGTIHRLHVSEMGKIAAKSPDKALEIKTGSLPAVPKTGVAIVESTAEGMEGEFFDMATRAEARSQIPAPLTIGEFAFHFFPWHTNPEYVLDPTGVIITEADHRYFARVEVETCRKLSLPQRAWYVSQRENGFAGDTETMWREFPSTSDECWRRSTEGTYFAKQLARARTEGRITIVPHIEHLPVNTFWDIGAGDGTAIWLHQYVGTQHRFIGFLEGWGEGYAHYIRDLRATRYVFGGMFLPHDAEQERQMADKVGSPLSILTELAPDWSWHIVPRVQTLQHGIDMTRAVFAQLWFDETATKAGLDHIALYKKKWNRSQAAWSDEPEKLTGHSEAADALRQFAQGFDPALIHAQTRPSRKHHRHLGGVVL